MKRVLIDYIWIDGNNQLKSKTRVIELDMYDKDSIPTN